MRRFVTLVGALSIAVLSVWPFLLQTALAAGAVEMQVERIVSLSIAGRSACWRPHRRFWRRSSKLWGCTHRRGRLPPAKGRRAADFTPRNTT